MARKEFERFLDSFSEFWSILIQPDNPEDRSAILLISTKTESLQIDRINAKQQF